MLHMHPPYVGSCAGSLEYYSLLCGYIHMMCVEICVPGTVCAGTATVQSYACFALCIQLTPLFRTPPDQKALS